MDVNVRDVGPRLLVDFSRLPFGWQARDDGAIEWTVFGSLCIWKVTLSLRFGHRHR